MTGQFTIILFLVIFLLSFALLCTFLSLFYHIWYFSDKKRLKIFFFKALSVSFFIKYVSCISGDFYILFYIFCCDNIHTRICHIFENHISNMNRCRNLNSFQCFHTVKDFSFRNVFFCLYRYHVNAAAIIGLSSTAS